MFDILENAIDNALEVVDDLLSGELPSRRKVARLIASGVSVVAIAEATGLAVDVVQSIIDGGER